MFRETEGISINGEPKIHELRVAVFSLSQRALIGSFSSPSLFVDVHPINNGLIGISHEDRARTYFNRQPEVVAMPALKMLGRLGTVLLTEEDGQSHEVSGVAVATEKNYNFRLFRLKRYDIDAVTAEAERELCQPGSTTLDTIDAHFLTEALTSEKLGPYLR